jgi:uncharacterized membrane protein YfcA
MSLIWAVAATILGVACFVFGLTGFGIGLVALSLLPFVMPPATAVPLVAVYSAVFSLVVALQLRREVRWPDVRSLLLGAVVGAPLGVWILATLPAGALRRLIGAVLLVIVTIEWRGLYPQHKPGKGWALCAGWWSGLLGGAVGTPGPPVILYAAAQRWSPRTFKATLQTFFLVNQLVTLGLYRWQGLLTREVMWLAITFAVPAILGTAAGIYLFDRTNYTQFRRLVFAFLSVSGLVLIIRG